MRGINAKESQFIDAYFGKSPSGRSLPKRNLTAAARAIGIGGKSPGRAGSRMFKLDHVKAEINRREKEIEAQRGNDPDNFTEKEIFDKLKAIADIDLSFIISEDGFIDPTKIHYLGQALRSYELKKERRVDGTVVVTHKVAIVDISKILIQLGKAHGMWKPKKDTHVNLSSLGDAFKAQIDISQDALLRASEDIDKQLKAKSEQYSGKKEESNG